MDTPALKKAKSWAVTHVTAAPDVTARTAGPKSTITAVYTGFKVRNGKRTGEVAIVFAVDHKLPITSIPPEDRIPADFDGVPTDVIEATYKALTLNSRQRPCAAGYSIGHVRISAGTFGGPVKRGASEDWLCLTNNHVAAESNGGSPGDRVLQPGKADGGSDPLDWWATLEEYVTINFEGFPFPGKKNQALGRAWWATVKGVGNAGAKLTGCPLRARVGLLAIGQPTPNLVDAAICRPREQSMLNPSVHKLGTVQGVRDLSLGDVVQKTGRTTEHTNGVVEGVNGMVSVQYGEGKLATFDDQVIVRSTDAGEFSAGGDSGSWVLTPDMYVGGLLFAGGGGQTICNKMSHVLSMLGVRVV